MEQANSCWNQQKKIEALCQQYCEEDCPLEKAEILSELHSKMKIYNILFGDIYDLKFKPTEADYPVL